MVTAKKIEQLLSLSDCCNARIIDETDLCSKCGEHCAPATDEMEIAPQNRLKKRRRLPSFFKDIRRRETIVPAHIVSQIRRYETEEFKFIRGYENKYIITSFGNVISLYRGKIHFLKEWGQDYSYNAITLAKNKFQFTKRTHRLVALHFVH